MIGEPPSSAGAFQDSDAEVGVTSLASSKVGGPGTPERHRRKYIQKGKWSHVVTSVVCINRANAQAIMAI